MSAARFEIGQEVKVPTNLSPTGLARIMGEEWGPYNKHFRGHQGWVYLLRKVQAPPAVPPLPRAHSEIDWPPTEGEPLYVRDDQLTAWQT